MKEESNIVGTSVAALLAVGVLWTVLTGEIMHWIIFVAVVYFSTALNPEPASATPSKSSGKSRKTAKSTPGRKPVTKRKK